MTKYVLAAVILATVAGAASVTPAAAAEYPWCAQYDGPNGARNCGFVSFQQCQATASGMGGFCERNTFYSPRSHR